MTSYELLDSGHGRKLERVGPYLIDRQCAVAFWRPLLPPHEWSRAQALHHRSDKGGGHWEFHEKLPDFWWIEYGGLHLKIKLTSFGHLGVFAEQVHQWEWFRDRVAKAPDSRILNLFGYTGGSTLCLAQAGAQVTHVDAAKGIVEWGRQNMEANNIPHERIRWITDDCLGYLKREKRRGSRYQGLILDPPSFGRGPNKEVFKIEESIEELLAACSEVLDPNPLFIHMSCHSPGFTPETLHNLLRDHFPIENMRIEKGEMWVSEKSSSRRVPSGTFCRAASLSSFDEEGFR